MIPKQNKNKLNRPVVLIVTLLIFVAALISSFGLHWQEDILSILPDDDPQIAQYRSLLKHFNLMDAVFVDVGLPDTSKMDGQLLITAADSIYFKMMRSGHFKRMIYKWDFQDLNNTLSLLRKHRAELFTKKDSSYLQDQMQPDSIYQSIVHWKKKLAESPAPFLVQQMLKDPLGFDLFLQRKLATLQNMNSDIQIRDGRLFNKDQQHILLIGYPQQSTSDSRSSGQIVAFMDTLVRQVETDAKVDVAYLSGHRFSVENAERIKRDIQVTITVSLIAISFLALLIYSQPFLMLLTLLPAIFGSVVSLGLMRWLVPEISAMVIGSGAMLIGLAVDYGIHFLFHIDQQSLTRNDSARLNELLQQLRKPLLLSAATTVVAFMTLRFSILPGYNQLGLFVSLGILSALGFVLLVLPQLLPGKRTSQKRDPIINLSLLFPPLFKWVRNHQRAVIGLLLLMTSLLIPGLMNIRFEGDVQKLNAVSDEIQADWDVINKSFGASMTSTYMVVNGESLDKALQKNERLAHLLQIQKKQGEVVSLNSLADIFPSEQTRIQNQQRWQKTFNPGQIERLDQLLTRSARKNGFRASVFNKFSSGLNNKTDFFSRSDLDQTILKDIFSNQVSQSASETAILTQIKIRSHNDLHRINQTIKQNMPDVVIYNGKDFVTHIVQLIFNELKRMGLIVISLIFLLLLLYKRSLKITFALLLPLLLSALWTFGIMGWLGIKINIINSIVSVFVFGLVVDYCFFLQSSCESPTTNRPEYLNHSGAAVTLSAFTTMFGLGALLLAKHPAMYTLGLTALLGIGSGLISVLFLIPLFFCPENEKENGVI